MVLRLEEFSKEVALGFSGVGFLYRTKVQKPPNGRTAERPNRRTAAFGGGGCGGGCGRCIYGMLI